MTDYIRDHVKSLSDDTLLQCVRDYDAYEETGFLGERTQLRFQVNELCEKTQRTALFVMIAERFMFEVFHHFAILYLEKN